MKINTTYRNKNTFPAIVTDVKGTIIFINEQASYTFKLKAGKDISSLVDIDLIKKMSMFSEKLDAVKTLHPQYNEATIGIFGEGINKRITLTFKKGHSKTDEDFKADRDILSVANNIQLNKNNKMISLPEFCDSVKKTIASTGNFVNVYLHEEGFFQNESHLQALVLCSISMMNEINHKKPVDLYIRRINDLLEVKIIVRVNEKQLVMGAQEVEALYPWSGIRIAFIDNICNTNNIDYSMNIIDKSLKIVYKIPELNKAPNALHASSTSFSMWMEMYELLKPRDYILSSLSVID